MCAYGFLWEKYRQIKNLPNFTYFWNFQEMILSFRGHNLLEFFSSSPASCAIIFHSSSHSVEILKNVCLNFYVKPVLVSEIQISKEQF